jgi:hypothetical protein
VRQRKQVDTTRGMERSVSGAKVRKLIAETVAPLFGRIVALEERVREYKAGNTRFGLLGRSWEGAAQRRAERTRRA